MHPVPVIPFRRSAFEAHRLPTGSTGPASLRRCAACLGWPAWTTRSIRWSFRQALHGMTGPYHLDGAPDLTSHDGMMRHGVDGCGSTSNP